MPSIQDKTSLKEYQSFTEEIYGLSNARYFDTIDILNNVGKFAMRGMKGIRKNEKEKAENNFIISLSWFMSVMNQLRIDVEQEIWERFPFLCPYCATSPCTCKEKRIVERQKVVIDEIKRPKTIKELQNMFEVLYPPENRTLAEAGIHLAEELGEFSEAIFKHKGSRNDKDFTEVTLEAADVIACLMGVFNSLGTNLAEELTKRFSDNCHVCHKAPCACNFTFITEFKS